MHEGVVSLKKVHLVTVTQRNVVYFAIKASIIDPYSVNRGLYASAKYRPMLGCTVRTGSHGPKTFCIGKYR